MSSSQVGAAKVSRIVAVTINYLAEFRRHHDREIYRALVSQVERSLSDQSRIKVFEHEVTRLDQYALMGISKAAYQYLRDCQTVVVSAADLIAFGSAKLACSQPGNEWKPIHSSALQSIVSLKHVFPPQSPFGLLAELTALQDVSLGDAAPIGKRRRTRAS